jgi:hypothetical protein
MAELPDPDTFGESGPKPSDSIDADDYHSLFEWEETEK